MVSDMVLRFVLNLYPNKSSLTGDVVGLWCFRIFGQKLHSGRGESNGVDTCVASTQRKPTREAIKKKY